MLGHHLQRLRAYHSRQLRVNHTKLICLCVQSTLILTPVFYGELKSSQQSRIASRHSAPAQHRYPAKGRRACFSGGRPSRWPANAQSRIPRAQRALSEWDFGHGRSMRRPGPAPEGGEGTRTGRCSSVAHVPAL